MKLLVFLPAQGHESLLSVPLEMFARMEPERSWTHQICYDCDDHMLDHREGYEHCKISGCEEWPACKGRVETEPARWHDLPKFNDYEAK